MHYLVKCKGSGLAVYNNEFILSSAYRQSLGFICNDAFVLDVRSRKINRFVYRTWLEFEKYNVQF